MSDLISHFAANIMDIFTVGLLTAGIRITTPILLAALGYIIAARVGLLNLGLEGMMLFGAFISVLATYFSGSPWFGVLIACTANTIIGLLFGVLCIKFKSIQSVVGLGLNIAALGITTVGISALWGVKGVSPRVIRLNPVNISFLEPYPFLNDILGNQTPIAWIALGIVIASLLLLFRTSLGVQMRATGENPAAADAAGVPVYSRQYLGAALSGLFCGLAGVDLAIGQVSYFGQEMTAGRGWMGFAVGIFSRFHPITAVFGSVLFGILDAFQMRAASLWAFPSQWFRMIPYIATLLVVAGIGGVRPPRHMGKPYIRENK